MQGGKLVGCFPEEAVLVLKERNKAAPGWAELAKRRTSAQVVFSRFVCSSPVSSSVLTAQSLDPASDSVAPSLSAPPPLILSLSPSKINKHQKII